MINIIVQNGMMSTLGSTWRLRRLIIGMLALVVIAVSIHMHSGSTETAGDTDVELTQLDETGGGSGSGIPHTRIHHDHHAELRFEAEGIHAAPLTTPDRPLDRTGVQQVFLTFDRPPDAAWC